MILKPKNEVDLEITVRFGEFRPSQVYVIFSNNENLLLNKLTLCVEKKPKKLLREF